MIHDFELDGPIVYIDAEPRPGRWREWILFCTRLGLAFCVFFAIAFLLFMPRSSCCNWPRIRQIQCSSNLRQIALALDGYRERYGVLPPAYIADASGRRMHSWRVLILPFLDSAEASLYEEYDFREPWDGPHNRRLMGEMPGLFQCPSPNLPRSTGMTNYVVITGPGAMFPGPAPVRLAEIGDGPADTLMLAETLNVKVPWTAPIDLDFRTMSLEINDPQRLSIASLHSGGANVAFGDARVRFLSDTLGALALRSLITSGGREWKLSEEQLDSH